MLNKVYLFLRVKGSHQKKVIVKILLNTHKMGLIGFLILFAMVFLSFRFNFFYVVSNKWFQNHQLDSDELVIDKLAARTLGITDSYFLGRIKGGKHKTIDSDLIKYANAKEFKKIILRNSNTGFSQILLNPFWDVTVGFLKDHPMRFLYGFGVVKTIVSLINALIISLLLLWLVREFPTKFMWSFLILTLYFQDWVTIFGKSAYWHMWSWFAPMVLNLYFLKGLFKSDEIEPHKMKIGLTLSQCVFICSINLVLIYLKCLMGYEYISTILIAMVLPFVYYAIKLNNFNILKATLPLALVGFCAFFLALATHYFLLQLEFNNPKDILQTIILKRTYALGGLSSIPEVYHESLKVSPFFVVFKYLVSGRIVELFLLLVCSWTAWYSWKKGMLKNDRKCLALFVMMVISMAGPLSWYVLAKGHSHIHKHMNYVLWYLPLNYLIYTFMLYVLSPFLEKKFSKIRSSSLVN